MDDGSCIYLPDPNEICGCMDPSALNYDPNATMDDGSCIYGPTTTDIYGCMDSNAWNYNPDATIDDGSCFYWPGAPVNNFPQIFSSNDALIPSLLKGQSLAFGENLSPNPTNGWLKVTVNSAEDQDVQVVLFNQLGQQVKQVNKTLSNGGQVLEVNAADLEVGIYLLSVLSKGDAIYTRQFVKTE